MTRRRVCSVPGCVAGVVRFGCCREHHPVCSLPLCRLPVRSSGLCTRHYRETRVGVREDAVPGEFYDTDSPDILAGTWVRSGGPGTPLVWRP